MDTGHFPRVMLYPKTPCFPVAETVTLQLLGGANSFINLPRVLPRFLITCRSPALSSRPKHPELGAQGPVPARTWSEVHLSVCPQPPMGLQTIRLPHGEGLARPLTRGSVMQVARRFSLSNPASSFPWGLQAGYGSEICASSPRADPHSKPLLRGSSMQLK